MKLEEFEALKVGHEVHCIFHHKMNCSRVCEITKTHENGGYIYKRTVTLANGRTFDDDRSHHFFTTAADLCEYIDKRDKQIVEQIEREYRGKYQIAQHIIQQHHCEKEAYMKLYGGITPRSQSPQI